MTTLNFWPIVSTVASLLTVVIGALLARWIAGVVQNLRSDIRIAILEQNERNAKEFATKEYVDDRVKLIDRIEAIPVKVRNLLRVRDDHDTPGVVQR